MGVASEISQYSRVIFAFIWNSVFGVQLFTVRLYFFKVSKDCNVGPINFNINTNAQQIVRSIAIRKHEQTVKQRMLEEFKTYLLTNVSSLQPTSSEWGSGITTRYIHIRLTVLNDN